MKKRIQKNYQKRLVGEVSPRSGDPAPGGESTVPYRKGLKVKLFALGVDGRLHEARLRIKTRDLKRGFARKGAKYLYLSYRDGATVRDIYVTKVS